MNRIILAFAVLLAATSAFANDGILYTNDFEDDPVGIYSVANLRADWNSPGWNDGVDEGRVSITDDADAFGDRSLVVNYEAGETTGSKAQWKLDLGDSYEELFLTYRVRFDDDFDFVRGGKLPGLIGGVGNTGGSKPNGADGWSARMMWRTDGSGGSRLNPNQANAVQYLYHPDQPTQFGHDQRWNDGSSGQWATFDSDVWYHFQHRIVMNTPGQHDGIVQAWLDGEMVLDVDDIRFRDVASLKIDELYFSTFFGGSSEVWEPDEDQQIYFDDFVIATEYITIPGDYNIDGTVDERDRQVWLANEGSPAGTLPNDFVGGPIGTAQLNAWQENQGNSTAWPSDPSQAYSPLDLNLDQDISRDDLFAACNQSLDITPYLDQLNTVLADIDFDGEVGFSDFLELSRNFGSDGSYAEGNIDCLGSIDFADFLALSARFGDRQSAVASVPEPDSSLAWIVLLIARLAVRRSRP